MEHTGPVFPINSKRIDSATWRMQINILAEAKWF